jgi:hypothetical protein
MRRLVVVYDVSDLTDDEVNGLALEAEVQAEASEHHPDVPAGSFVMSDPIEVEAIDRELAKRRFES